MAFLVQAHVCTRLSLDFHCQISYTYNEKATQFYLLVCENCRLLVKFTPNLGLAGNPKLQENLC